ncbi:MAG: hypothetical protein SOY80_03510 [Bacilli bacterium]|nr:hypothetical protein [Bacilli bacterium]MDY4052392.1 hypothetical protein [Bacilli bacterium]
MNIKIELDDSLKMYNSFCILNDQLIEINELEELDIEKKCKLTLKFTIKENKRKDKLVKQISKAIILLSSFLKKNDYLTTKATEYTNTLELDNIQENATLKYTLDNENTLNLSSEHLNVILNDTIKTTNLLYLEKNKKLVLKTFSIIFAVLTLIIISILGAAIFNGSILLFLLGAIISIFLVIISVIFTRRLDKE